ncbi:hypothetical protein [Nocardia altamirensis]|uniref:hypothetical protein n=1 Tax=Nocardia altamirensis TaxID=472158 RepID=UPI0008404DFE|nr:hypothetical protein [Nocardia altamirensis]
MTCKPVLTPQDCEPKPVEIAPVPATGQLPADQVVPSVHPVAPPIGGDGPDSMLFGGMLPIPDWTWAEVGRGLSVLGAGIGFVLAATTVLMVAANRLAWTPARMRNWMFGSALALPGATMLLHFDLAAPSDQMRDGATAFASGRYAYGLAVMAVGLIPAAWFLAAVGVANRRVQLITHGWRSPAATERALWMQSQREQAAATRLARYRIPFSTGGLNPHMLIGRLAVEETAAPPKSRWRMLLGRYESRLIVPWINMREHMVTVASSGKGKTTLMLRALLSWHITAWLRHRQWWRLDRPGRPLTVVIDCNGGPESVKLAHRVGAWYAALGIPASRIGYVGVGADDPQRVQLALFDIPARADLFSVLSAMISGGSTPTTDTERYFHNQRESLLHLILDAPARIENRNGVPTPVGENRPKDWLDFLSRFDAKRLARLWGGVFDDTVDWQGVPGVDLKIAATKAGKQPVMDSALAEFSNLYLALGDSFEGAAQITDFDVLYIILEGVKAPDRARAQFAAIGCMLEQLADRDHGRETLLAVDEFSAVSDGRTRAAAWVMRFRKAKIGSWWFAQHWNGLGHDDDARQALIGSGSGGGLHGGQEFGVEKLAEGYGTKRRFDLSRKLIGGAAAGDEGNVQAAERFLFEPNRVRRMGKGDIVFISQGRARWGRVSAVDDTTRATVRPLPGLSVLRPTTTEPTVLAPVIDLTKRRHG